MELQRAWDRNRCGARKGKRHGIGDRRTCHGSRNRQRMCPPARAIVELEPNPTKEEITVCVNEEVEARPKRSKPAASRAGQELGTDGRRLYRHESRLKWARPNEARVELGAIIVIATD